MPQILMVGNGGSGKSYAAKILAENAGLRCVHLDVVFWKPGGCVEKRAREDVLRDLDQVRASSNWVVEGAFGDLIEYCVPSADLFVFLDLPWEECEANLRMRGYEPEKWADPELGKSKFEGLLAWAGDYWKRDDRFSRVCHSRIFNSFGGEKLRLKSRQEVSDWLKASPTDV
jgi:adenylate kinase family enzyme